MLYFKHGFPIGKNIHLEESESEEESENENEEESENESENEEESESEKNKQVDKRFTPNLKKRRKKVKNFGLKNLLVKKTK